MRPSFRANAAVGDILFVKGDEPGAEPYIARALALKKDAVKLQWYYKPEDTVSGRQVGGWLCTDGFRPLFRPLSINLERLSQKQRRRD